MNINLGDKTSKVLQSLSKEDGITEEAFLEKLILKEDSRRHVVWSRKAGKFVRSKCGKSTCQEKRKLDPRDIAD